MLILGYLASVLMGVSLGLIGGGGSILTVPILLYLFHQDPLLATTNSLFIVGFTALAGAALSAKKGSINLRMGLIFAIPSFAGVYVSRHFILPKLPEVLFSFSRFTLTKPVLVMFAFSALMIMASRSMIRSGRVAASSHAASVLLPPPALSISIKGFFIGCVTGFVGAGGGFLIIPALVLLLNLPMRIAIGTSLAIIAANSLFGFAISPSAGATDWTLLVAITILGIIGIFMGQRFSTKVAEADLKKGFGFFVLGIGSLMLIDQVFKML